MPPKSGKRKGKKGQGRTPPIRPLSKSEFPSGAVVTARQPSFKLQQGTSGTGAITSNLTGVSLTNASNIRIDPFSIGSRIGLFANLYCQYRVRRMVIEYIPDETSSGVLDQPAGAGTTPSYGNRSFAMGWNKDPSITLTTADGVVEFGGQDGNTSRRMTLRVPASDWLWNSTTSASPTGIDDRMACHGQLSAIFRTTSTTTATTYGRIDISLEIEFRYPAQTSIVGNVEAKERTELLVAADTYGDQRKPPDTYGDRRAQSPLATGDRLPASLSVKEDSSERKVSSSVSPGPARSIRAGDPTQGATGWFR